MRKKHFIILGRSGLIYFSWVLIVLFLCLIFLYESTKVFNWPALICALLFLILLVHTYFNSYWTNEIFKLPFRAKAKLTSEPAIILDWQLLKIYKIKIAEFGQYYLLRFEKKSR